MQFSERGLQDIIKKHRGDSQPFAIPYIVAMFSGDFAMDFQAHLPAARNTDFVSVCYAYAKDLAIHRNRKEESRVFSVLASESMPYVNLLADYYKYLADHLDIVLTDADFKAFKTDFQIAVQTANKLAFPVAVRNRPSDKLLV